MAFNIRVLLSFAAPLLLFGTGTSCVWAQDTSQFYKGKTIVIVVGNPAGGSNDGYARLVARHLGKHLDGKPLVIVKNMGGAGGAVAASYVAHVAPKDGTYIAAVQGTALLDPILKEAGSTDFAPASVNYLGSAGTANFVCIVRSNAPATSFEQTLKTQIVIGGASPGGFLTYVPLMLNNVLGTKFKVISGYPGTREIILAMQKREVDGMCGIPWATLKLQYSTLLQTQEIKVILQESNKSVPELNDKEIPLVVTFARNEEQRRILSIVNSQQTFQFPYFVAADVPIDLVQLLRRAFVKTLHDPELLSEAAKLAIDIDPIPGEEMQTLLQEIYASPQALVESVRKAVKSN